MPEMPLRCSIKSELAQFYLFDWFPASGSYMHVVRKSTEKTVSATSLAGSYFALQSLYNLGPVQFAILG